MITSNFLPINLSKMSWKRVEPLSELCPAKRSGATAGYFNREMYLFGGFSENLTALNDLWAFNLDTLHWRQIQGAGEIPARRTSHSMCIDADEAKLYVLFGSGDIFGETNLGDIFEFDLLYHRWTKLEFRGVNISPRYGQSAVLWNKRIFVFGGTFGRAFSDEFFELDLRTMICSRIIGPDVICPRYKHEAILVRDQMLIYGGATTANYELNDLYLISLETSEYLRPNGFVKWFTKITYPERYSGQRPRGRFCGSMCISPNTERIWLFGGSNREECFSDFFQLKEWDLWSWTKLSVENGPPARYFHCSMFDPVRGEVVIWGGKKDSTRYNDMYRIAVEKSELHNSLIRDMTAFINSPHAESLSDVELESKDGEYIECHMVMIIARCPKLIETVNMHEIALNVSSECLRAFKSFLYLGDCLQNDVSVFVELITLARELSLPVLCIQSEQKLFRLMNPAVATSVLAQLPGDGEFETYLQNYIQYNADAERPVARLSRRPTDTLSEDLFKMFNNPLASDFNLKIGETNLCAHLFVLSCRSEYFRALGEGVMIESAEKCCKFDARELSLIEPIIRYIYGEENGVDPRQELGTYFGLTPAP